MYSVNTNTCYTNNSCERKVQVMPLWALKLTVFVIASPLMRYFLYSVPIMKMLV